MVDFSESFDIGISAAEDAEARRQEIADVFYDLNEQLVTPTEGKILIERVEFYEPRKSFKVSLFEVRPSYWAIAAKNPLAELSNNVELAKWKQDRAGYPCKITFGDEAIYCEDKEALERGLSVLLRDPVVGEALRNLMNRPSKDAQAADVEEGDS